jgi:hypothetical protein
MRCLGVPTCACTQIAYMPYKSQRANHFATASYLCLLWTYLATLLSGVADSCFGQVIVPVSSVLRLAVLLYGFWPVVAAVWQRCIRRRSPGSSNELDEGDQQLELLQSDGYSGLDVTAASAPTRERASTSSSTSARDSGSLQQPLL